MFNLLEFDVKFLIEWQAWLTLWIMSQLIIYLYELMIVFGSAWWMFLGRKFLSSHTHTIPKQKFIYCNLGTIFPVWSIRSFWFLIPCINPWFGRPCDKLWIFFLIAIFIMLQKNAFGQKKFQISCTGSKVPFWQFFNFSKMALLNPCMKFDFVWKIFLLFNHLIIT